MAHLGKRFWNKNNDHPQPPEAALSRGSLEIKGELKAVFALLTMMMAWLGGRILRIECIMILFT